MKIMPRHYLFIAGILSAFIFITLVIMKGKPEDRVGFEPIAVIGENILSGIDKLTRNYHAITDEEEVRIGDKIHEKVFGPILSKSGDLVTEKYVDAVGQQVSLGVKRRAIPYRFHIIDSSFPSATCVPGGHVYVNKGLLDKLESESELAAILGHEMTHIDLKHSIGALRFRITGGGLRDEDIEKAADIGYQIFMRPAFSEDQEKEADAGGVWLAKNSGYHPLAIIRAFDILKEYDYGSHASGHVTPLGETLEAVGGLFYRYFNSHPPVDERTEYIMLYVRENNFIDGKTKYYVGRRNYSERVPYREKAYREELVTPFFG